MNNFWVRTLSGALFVILVVGSIILGSITFSVFFSIVTFLAVFEFHKLTNKQSGVTVNPYLSAIGGVLLFLTAHFLASGAAISPFYLFYGLFVMVVIVSSLYQHKPNPIHNWAYFLAGQIIIALPMALLNYIIFADGLQRMLVLSLFIIIWVNDTGAYLTGVTFGKHKLFLRISPKKSWEGFFGGAMFSLVAGYVLSRFVPELNPVEWIIFSIIVVIAGTFGDLTESLLKRTLEVKDSGNIIPGHGGILDRFDSLLLASPFIFIYLSILL